MQKYFKYHTLLRFPTVMVLLGGTKLCFIYASSKNQQASVTQFVGRHLYYINVFKIWNSLLYIVSTIFGYIYCFPISRAEIKFLLFVGLIKNRSTYPTSGIVVTITKSHQV